MDEELLRKLEERLANGEISEETYLKIKSRHESKETTEEEELEDDMEDDMDEIEGEAVETVTKNVRLTGARKIKGCNCEYFSSSGASKVEGDLYAKEAKISGSTKIEGDLVVKKLNTGGSIKVEGKTEAGYMDLSGASKFEGPVKANRVESSGATKFVSDIVVDEMETSGAFKAVSNINARTFKGSGAFAVEGTLTGSEIILKPSGDCRVGHIKGGDVLVESGGAGGLLSFIKKGKLSVESIKGEAIYLENTKAKLVEGDSVKIGPGCSVETVRGKDIKVHESASVKNREKL